GTTAVGAIVSPFLAGLLADKSFATQKLLGMLHIFGAVLLYAASLQGSFAAFYGVILLYALGFMPTLALTNSLAIRQMPDTQQAFGATRTLGTVGWIVAGLIVGGMGVESTAVPLHIAAACSLAMGLYCFTLPDAPPLARAAGGGAAVSRAALSFLRRRP